MKKSWLWPSFGLSATPDERRCSSAVVRANGYDAKNLDRCGQSTSQTDSPQRCQQIDPSLDLVLGTIAPIMMSSLSDSGLVELARPA